VESFDSGVGRFDQTLGPGQQRHVWQPSQNIRSFFVQDGQNDRRYAELGESFDAHGDVIGFSVWVQAVAATNGDDVSSGVGFWNSADDFTRDRLGISFGIGEGDTVETGISIDGRYADGSPVARSSAIPFSFFTDYYVDVLVDGPSRTVTADVFQGIDANGLFLGTLATMLDPGKTLLVDSLGMGAVSPGGEAIVLFIDNFAFTIPEPATLALVLFGSVVLVRRRRLCSVSELRRTIRYEPRAPASGLARRRATAPSRSRLG